MTDAELSAHTLRRNAALPVQTPSLTVTSRVQGRGLRLCRDRGGRTWIHRGGEPLSVSFGDGDTLLMRGSMRNGPHVRRVQCSLVPLRPGARLKESPTETSESMLHEPPLLYRTGNTHACCADKSWGVGPLLPTAR